MCFFRDFCSVTFEVLKNVHFWKFHEKEHKKLYNNDAIRYSKKYNFTVKIPYLKGKFEFFQLYTLFLQDRHRAQKSWWKWLNMSYKKKHIDGRGLS